MKELIAKYILVVLTCAVKYIVGVITALSTGLNFIETLICTVGGGMLGVIFFMYLWEIILVIYKKGKPYFIYIRTVLTIILFVAFAKYMQYELFLVLAISVIGAIIGAFVLPFIFRLISTFYYSVFPKRDKEIRINKLIRIMVKLIKKYELYGIAFLTPLLLSVPVGVVLALALDEDKWRIKRYMFFSFLGWTLLIYAISALMHVKVDEVF